MVPSRLSESTTSATKRLANVIKEQSPLYILRLVLLGRSQTIGFVPTWQKTIITPNGSCIDLCTVTFWFVTFLLVNCFASELTSYFSSSSVCRPRCFDTSVSQRASSHNAPSEMEKKNFSFCLFYTTGDWRRIVIFSQLCGCRLFF